MTDNISTYIDEFTGKMLRVRTNHSHYRGMCATIGPKHFDIVLKDVLEKTPSGWIQISDMMIILGRWVESIYVESAFPFDEHEKIILSVEDGEVKIDNDI